ncbi:ImmA/IrrE family metallo-endopeptidase [Rhodopirellula bahusiensis]|uniref:ImmA/IrrE family metallo-endopeptidase n=2 Tax=Rhodopirellula bahusiensis TaxID=2014065 RepID=UPI0032632A9F
MTLERKLEQAKLRKATKLGEQIAFEAGFLKPPIDPLKIIDREQGRVKAFGDDFGDDFDGRLEFQRPRFLLFYNTKYNQWSHDGQRHPKVTFTIGHELGHYFLEPHRNYLMSGGGAHGSETQFESNRIVEREADCFSSGLLMPKFLLGKIVNQAAPNLDGVKHARDQFQVSLTSMLVRWVQLCDFPCAVASVRDHMIEWGFCSPGLKQAGGYGIKRDEPVISRTTSEFIQQDTNLAAYREGVGQSIASHWIPNLDSNFVFAEQLIVVPSTRQVLVFLMADEDDTIRPGKFY